MSQLDSRYHSQQEDEKEDRKFIFPIWAWFVLALLLNLLIILGSGCLASNTRPTGIIPANMLAQSTADYQFSTDAVFAPLDPAIIDEINQDNNALQQTPEGNNTGVQNPNPLPGTVTPSITPTPSNTPIPTQTAVSATSTPSPTTEPSITPTSLLPVETSTPTVTTTATAALTSTPTNTPFFVPTSTPTFVPTQPPTQPPPPPPTQPPPPPPTQPPPPPPTQPPPPPPTQPPPPPPTEPPPPTATPKFVSTPIPTQSP